MEKREICLEKRILEKKEKEQDVGLGTLEAERRRIYLDQRALEVRTVNSF